MKEKFTEGPWQWEHNCLFGKDFGYTVPILEDVYFPEENEMSAENKALIIAAPDLFKALNDATNMLDDIASGRDWGAIEDQIEDNMAALSKAMGDND